MTPYLDHLQSSVVLITNYEATRAGFVALALEKNRKATPYVFEARALQTVATKAQSPSDLLKIIGIENGFAGNRINPVGISIISRKTRTTNIVHEVEQ